MTHTKAHSASAAGGLMSELLIDRLRTARLLLVDADSHRLFQARQWIESAEGREPLTAQSGDEALDVLGSCAQQVDVAAIWPVLPDDDRIDLVGILRRCRSPVRIMLVTASSASDFPRAGRLAGTSYITDARSPLGLVREICRALTDARPVRDIVSDRRVPAALSSAWAQRIYGAPPGTHLHGDLD